MRQRALQKKQKTREKLGKFKDQELKIEQNIQKASKRMLKNKNKKRERTQSEKPQKPNQK